MSFLKKAVRWTVYILAILSALVVGSVIQFQILEHPIVAGGVHCGLWVALAYAWACTSSLKNPDGILVTIIVVLSAIITVITAFFGWGVYALLAMALVGLVEKSMKRGPTPGS